MGRTFNRPIIWIVLISVLVLSLAVPAFWQALQRELRQQRSMKGLAAQMSELRKALDQPSCVAAELSVGFTQLAELSRQIDGAFPELVQRAPSFVRHQADLRSQALASAQQAASADSCPGLTPAYERTKEACEACHRDLRGR